MLTISIAENLSIGPDVQGGDWQAEALDGSQGVFPHVEDPTSLGMPVHDYSEAEINCASVVQAQWEAQAAFAAQNVGEWFPGGMQQYTWNGNAESEATWGYQSWANTNMVGTTWPEQPYEADETEQTAKPAATSRLGAAPPLPRLASPIVVPLPKPLMATGVEEIEFDLMELPPSGPQRVFSPGLQTTFLEPRPEAGSRDIELPPGLNSEQSLQSTPSTADGAALSLKASLPALPSETLPQGLSISSTVVNDTECTRVEWLVDKFCAKLQPNMSRPLVSPPFAACGLPNLRLMIFLDTPEAVKNARSRDRKAVYANILKKGPLSGALKLKADCLTGTTMIKFNLTVGSVRVGPVTYDFSEAAIHGVENFGSDWLKQVNPSDGSLSVGIEILSASTP